MIATARQDEGFDRAGEKPLAMPRHGSIGVGAKLALLAGAIFAVAPGHAASLLEQLSPSPTSYVETVDYNTVGQNQDGYLFGPQTIDLTATVFRLAGTDGVHGLSEGCAAGDFGSGVSGHIVLLSRGTCLFTDKLINAQAAGALAVLIAEDDPTATTVPALGGFDPDVHITAFRLSYDLGALLADQTLRQTTTIRLALGDNLVSSFVPEPASWAMLLLGFGLTGSALRDRRRRAVRQGASRSLRFGG